MLYLWVRFSIFLGYLSHASILDSWLGLVHSRWTWSHCNVLFFIARSVWYLRESFTMDSLLRTFLSRIVDVCRFCLDLKFFLSYKWMALSVSTIAQTLKKNATATSNATATTARTSLGTPKRPSPTNKSPTTTTTNAAAAKGESLLKHLPWDDKEMTPWTKAFAQRAPPTAATATPQRSVPHTQKYILVLHSFHKGPLKQPWSNRRKRPTDKILPKKVPWCLCYLLRCCHVGN